MLKKDLDEYICLCKRIRQQVNYMADKRFQLVKCGEKKWGIIDNSLDSIGQLVIQSSNENDMVCLINLLNELYEKNIELLEKNEEPLIDRIGLLGRLLNYQKGNQKLKQELKG